MQRLESIKRKVDYKFLFYFVVVVSSTWSGADKIDSLQIDVSAK